MLTQCMLYSVNEVGLYDYIICNEDVDSAGKELKAVAERALQGLVGRPADQPPAAASAASAPEPASKVWHCGGCSTVLVLGSAVGLPLPTPVELAAVLSCEQGAAHSLFVTLCRQTLASHGCMPNMCTELVSDTTHAARHSAAGPKTVHMYSPSCTPAAQ